MPIFPCRNITLPLQSSNASYYTTQTLLSQRKQYMNSSSAADSKQQYRIYITRLALRELSTAKTNVFFARGLP